MRDATERPEAVESGVVKLVGTDTNKIVEEVSNLLSNNTYYQEMITNKNPFGDGFAGERIAKIVHNFLFNGGTNGIS